MKKNHTNKPQQLRTDRIVQFYRDKGKENDDPRNNRYRNGCIESGVIMCVMFIAEKKDSGSEPALCTLYYLCGMLLRACTLPHILSHS